MNYEKKRKNFIFIAIIAFMVVISGATIAFSLSNYELTIGPSTARMSPINWSVKFDNTYTIAMTKSGSSVIQNTMAAVSSDATIISPFDVVFTRENDFIEYKFKIINEGVIDAKVAAVSLGAITCTGTNADPDIALIDKDQVCDNLILTLKDATGTNDFLSHTTLIPNILLASGGNVIVTLRLEYNNSILPTSDVNISIGATTITYTSNQMP